MFMESPYSQVKLSTESLMEELQLVTLETDELESEKNHMQREVLDFSVNQVSAEGNKTYCFSFQSYSKFKNWWIAILMKECSL